ncbi:RNA-directed DNA polymerase, eukaryota, reverse transcriptase zinc-binding domain protein [Tanacetum coccineum]
MTNKNRQSKRKPKLPSKFDDHVMSNLSKTKENSIASDDIVEIRVTTNDSINEVEENSNMMNKEENIVQEKVIEGDIAVNDEMNHKESESVNLDLNKGVFGCANMEFDDFIDTGSNGIAVKGVDKAIMKTYASTAEKAFLNKNLFMILTSKKGNRDEVVVFDEEIVEEGSKKEEEGMNTIVDQSPWMVNGKPLMTQKWNPDICVEKAEPSKPLIMDEMTASMCHNGVGRSAFTRVLVEIDAAAGFNETIEIQYKDKDNNVFGHFSAKCHKNGSKKDQINASESVKVATANEGFMEVRSKSSNMFPKKSNVYMEKPESSKKGNQFVTPIKTKSPEKKSWNIGDKNVAEISKSANKYSVLSVADDNDILNEESVDRRLEVDRFILMKSHPSKEDMTNWNYDMKQYFKIKWNEVFRKENANESKSDDDLVEENMANDPLVANEFEGMDPGRNVKFFCRFIYANNSGRERQELWKMLEGHKRISNKRPWILMGDFKVTLKANEHSAGGSFISSDMMEFNECVNDLELEDICSTGFQFTWTKSLKDPNSSIMKKLDRIMINEEFIQQFQKAYGRFLPFIISDHSLAVITIPEGLKKKKRSFRFVNYIADKEEFSDCVRKEWEANINGCHMYKVVQKLKRLKKPLNKLNWKNGDLSEKVKSLKVQLANAQIEVEKDPFNKELKNNATGILNEYVTASNDELKLLHQKAKIKWLSKGDQNTTYFHGILKSRKHKGRIKSICDENGRIYEGDDVANVFVEHFKKFLGTKHEVEPFDSVEVAFDKVLNQYEAASMIGNVIDEEIKEAIFDIDSNKASGPDGFTSKINATIIALVPKVDVPNKVSEFRPIACCNVIYKSISKILTNRIKIGLQKVVNLNQSDFIPGRHIQDNILIAQELLKGYQRKKGAKSNIQKAREFKYHYGCKELKLSNMCFANDLLVLCNGDVKSVEVIKITMEQFSSISGLFPNIGKSTIFFGSVPVNIQSEILKILPFQVGSLPMKYLGVPLIAKKLGINDCKSLVNRASVYMSPSNTITEIEKLLKGFLWCQGPLSKGKAKVAWKQVCMPKEEGGLGIKSLKKWNKVLLIKQLWKIINKQESLWVKWVNVVKLKGKSIWDIDRNYNDSCGWLKLLELRDRIKDHVLYCISNGKNTSVWFEKWDLKGPINSIIPRREWYKERYSDNETVVDMTNNRVWIWANQWYNSYPELRNIAIPTFYPRKKDKVCWLNNQNERKYFSTNQVWFDLRNRNEKVEWHTVVWFNQFQPRHAFLLWLAIKERLTTQDRLARWNCQVNAVCSLCKKEKYSHAHLFFKCEFAEQICESLKNKLGNLRCNNELENIVKMLSQVKSRKCLRSVVNKLALVAVVYYIWQERNWRIFKQDERIVDQMLKTINENVTMRLMSLKVNQTKAVIQVADSWNLKWKNSYLIIDC